MLPKRLITFTLFAALAVLATSSKLHSQSRLQWQLTNGPSQSTRLQIYGGELWSAYDSLLQVSDDYGDSWRNIHAPTYIDNFSIMPAGAIVVSGYQASPFVSTDSGITWKQIGTPNYMAVGDTLFALTDSTLLISTSFGNQWDTVLIRDSINQHETSQIVITPQGVIWVIVKPDSLYNEDSMYVSFDHGQSFGPIVAAEFAERYFFDSNGTAYSYWCPNIYKTSNNGITWDSITTPFQNWTDVLDLLSNDSVLLASFEHSGLYQTTDKGIAWINENAGLAGIDDRGMGCLSSQGGYVFLITDGGFYRAKDSILARNNSSFRYVYPVPHAPKDTNHYLDKVQSTSSSPHVQWSVAPNPLSESTTISFTPEASGYADVSIVNLLGVEVAHLFSGEVGVSEHSFVWSKPPSLPDGMYECLVRMNGRVETLPVVLLH